MIPGNEPSLRERVNAALEELTWEERTAALVTLLEEYGGEQAAIAYRQGYQSAELNGRDQLERAHGLIRKLTPELFVAETAVERVRELADQLDARGAGLKLKHDALPVTHPQRLSLGAAALGKATIAARIRDALDGDQ